MPCTRKIDHYIQLDECVLSDLEIQLGFTKIHGGNVILRTSRTRMSDTGGQKILGYERNWLQEMIKFSDAIAGLCIL